MKKNSVIKAILFTFLVYVVLSWIIPAGGYSAEGFVKGEPLPTGLSFIFFFPLLTLCEYSYAIIGIVVLLIGALYGVMNKTGVYQKLVEGTVKKFNGKEKVFLIISIIIFALLASLTNLTLPLIIMVPFFVAVILMLGYNKMTALLSTVGAILVGNMGTIFGYNYINSLLELKNTQNIVAQIALFVLLTTVLLIFVIKTSKIEKVEKKKGRKSTKKKETEEVQEEVIIPLYKKVEESKKSSKPLLIVLILTIVISLVAMFDWAGVLGVKETIFTTLHTKINEIQVNNYPIFANLLGTSVGELGSWANIHLAMIIIITILVIGFVYNLKVRETFDAAVEGMKEVLSVAVVAVLANILLLIVTNSSAVFFGTIFNSISNAFEKIPEIGFTINSAIGSVAYNESMHLINALYGTINTVDIKEMPQYIYIMQVMLGFVMMLVPTSVGLVIGLQYLDISFKEWFKENWKLLLSLLAVALILIIIVVLV